MTHTPFSLRAGFTAAVSAALLGAPLRAQPAPEHPPEPAAELQSESQPELTPTSPEVTPREDSVLPNTAPRVVALLAPDSTPDQRLESAASLLDAGHLGPIRSALDGEAGPAASAAAHHAITSADPVPAEWIGLLEDAALTSVSQDNALAAVASLAQIASRDALRSLVRVFEADLPPQVTTRAAEALARATGRELNPADPASVGAWKTWWTGAEWLPELDWQATLAEGFRARAEALAQERDALAGAVDTLYTRLYAQLPAADRTPLLKEMLEHPRRAIRVSGLRLVEQALLNGQAVDVSLAGATAASLADPSPEIRGLAARALQRFAPTDSAAAATAALATETDSAVAADLLTLIGSAGVTPQAAAMAERWLAQPDSAGDAAARLVLSSLSAGAVPDDGFEHRVRTIARNRLATDPTPPVVRLIGATGDETDLDLLDRLLSATPDQTLRAASIHAMALLPGGFATLTESATEQPALREPIAEALSRFAPGLESYRFILRLTGLPAEARSASLSRVAAALPDSALLAAARETPSPRLRAALLQTRLDSAPSDLDADTRRRLIVLLAESQALADEPAAVLVSLGLLDEYAQVGFGAELAALALKRLREAKQTLPSPVTCSPKLWAAALTRLAESDPDAAAALAEDAPLREHIRRDPEAEAQIAGTLERLRAAREAVVPVQDTPENLENRRGG